MYNQFFPGCNDGKGYDGDEPHVYNNFVGRFYNENDFTEYEGLEKGVPVLLNNTYPANLKASAIAAKGGTVQVFDKKSFREAKEEDLILSQHGFVFTPTENIPSIKIEASDISNTETTHRKMVSALPAVSVALTNTEASAASEVTVRYDELKEDVADYAVDAPKLFNTMELTLPELYVIRYDAEWAGINIPTLSEPIPLGIKVAKEGQTFVFSLVNSTLERDIILEDRLTGKTYNLSAGAKYSVSDLVVGENEGRFYLLLEEKLVEENPEEGEDVTTEIDDIIATDGIDIFSSGNSIIVSASTDVKLQEVVVSDIAGRSQVYTVSGQYIKIDLPVCAGVYTVNVIGDKVTRVEKIKLN